MSSNDVPGAKASNRDELVMGCWAEHEDGSLIFVESVENDRVVYSLFDVGQTPPIEYRDAMDEQAFKAQFSWKGGASRTVKGSKPGDAPDDSGFPDLKWTWHDKTPMPWDRVMKDFAPGSRPASAAGHLNAAERVARSLNLRAGAVREDEYRTGNIRHAARQIAEGIVEAIQSLHP